MKSGRKKFVKGKALIFAVLFATLACVSVFGISATPDDTIILYGDNDSILSLGESSNSELATITASGPINAVLNINVIDEDGNAISGLGIDLFYHLQYNYMYNQYVSSANTGGNGVASFDVSTEMLYSVAIDPSWDNPEGVHLAYKLIAIPSGTTKYTFTTYLYTLAENETSIELRTIDGMPFANTRINISRGDSPVWTGRTDDNGVAIVPNLAAYTRYNIDFDIPDKYCVRPRTLDIGKNRRYLTAIITLHGIYGSGISSRRWWDWTSVEPDYIYPFGQRFITQYSIYQFGQRTRLMCSSDRCLEILPDDKLIHTILSHPSYDRISYEQSIEHFGSVPVELPSLPTGFYEIVTKIERDGLVKDMGATLLWIYGPNSAPNYDISIDYPLIAHDNELTINITVSSVTEKALSCFVRTKNYACWGYGPVHPGEPWDRHYQVPLGPDGHLNLTIVVYDGPQLWYKLIEDVQVEDPNSDVQLTINISYKTQNVRGGALTGANLAVVYDSNSIWAYNPQLDTWTRQSVGGGDLQGARISDNLAVVYDSDYIWAYNPQLDTWKRQDVMGIQGVEISNNLALVYDSNSIWAYNPQLDTWKIRSVGGDDIQGAQISDNLAVVYDSDYIWAYNPQLDTWKRQDVIGFQSPASL